MGFENVEDVYTLTPMQEGMLYHTLSDPGSGVFLTQITCRLEGAFEPAAFREAWARLVRWHQVLRTAFLWDGLDEPLQVVRREAELTWRVEDWRSLTAEEQEGRLDAYLAADRRRGFDLAVAPLARMALLRLGDRSWRWVWSFQHMILDGWSARLLLRELAEGGEAPRPAFAYRDYLAWLAARGDAGGEDFWRRELAGFDRPTRVEDPAKGERGAGEAGAGERERASLDLPAAATAALGTFASGHGLTPSTVVQGAWAMLLGRLTREREVLFGLTTAGRPAELPGVEEAVGLFIHTLPLRLRLEPGARLVPWLRRVQERQLALRRWEHRPLAEIQKWSDLAPGEALFESILVFESHPADLAPAAGERFPRPLDLDFHEHSNYPLALLVVPGAPGEGRGAGLRLLLVYDPERFGRAFARTLLASLAGLLEAFAAAPPEQSLDAFSLAAAPKAEGGDAPPPGERSGEALIPRHFAEVAARRAREPAVIFAGEVLGYGELAARVGRLAARLRGRGVGPEVVVALLVERSMEMIVGLLAVLEAGGAYLPLDPSYPDEHLRLALAESSAPLVLTRASLAERLPRVGDGNGPGVFTFEEGESGPLPAAAELGRGGPDPESLAYVIFTSGSSGRPKGVMIHHRGLLESTRARDEVYGAPPGRYLLLSSFAFDSSVAGIFWTLARGGTLVLPGPGEERDLEALARLIAEHGVTHTLCLPALYQLLLAETESARLASLEVVIVAGEACPPALPAAHRRALPGARLYNEYGPTEGTVWCTVGEITGEDGRIPIGRAVPGCRTRLLDPARQPLPGGFAGELHLAGGALARGYLGRAALTAAAFRPLEGNAEAGGRSYATGDLAHAREDGSYCFLGRADAQVKIRGHRVETEGVVAALEAHPAVAEAAVVAHDAPGGASRRLVAYVAGRGGAPPRQEELREHLASRLPGPMVPELFVLLEELPRRPNGKLDPRALPAPRQESSGGAPRAPRDEVEELIAGIWQELLGLESVGVDENFFALGGDSILGIQMVSRIRQAGYAAEPRHVAAHPTIAELARLARPRKAAVEAAEAAAAPDGPVQPAPIQAWFFGRRLAAPAHWNLSLLLAQAADFDRRAFRAALAHLLAHHPQLRARFERGPDGTWRQVVEELGATPVPFTVVELPAAGREEALSRTIAAAQAAFDLGRAPLFRALLLAAPGGESRLLLTAHHLVVDPYSWSILLADLERAYGQLRAGGPVELPPATTAYGRWSSGLRTLAESPVLGRQLELWAAVPEPAALELPLDARPERAPTEADARVHRSRLGAELGAALTGAALAPYASRIDELLLAALLLALERWRGPGPVYLGLEGHGREGPVEGEDAPDLARTVGWSTAAYPLLLEVPAGADAGAAIRSVKEQLRRVPGDGSGFGILRYRSPDLEVRRRLDSLPEPPLLFNYLGRAGRAGSGTLGEPLEDAPLFARDPRNRRSHLLEVNARLRGGELELAWIYCRPWHRRRTVARLAEGFEAELRRLVGHCLSEEAGALTPSDFPAAELDEDDLATLLGQLE